MQPAADTDPEAPTDGRRWTWRRAALALAVAYGTYAAARWLGPGTAAAHGNAARIVDLERALGIAVESPVQRALDASALVWIFNHLYMAAQFVVVPAALLLVRRRSVPAFRRLRDTLLLTWVLATPINALFPVAPPRMAGIGIADTITASGSGALTSGLSTALYNPLAAVPSLHVAFAFAVGVAVYATARSRSLRLLALAWGPIVALTVVATGNHYLFDGIVGVALAAVAFELVRLPRPAPTTLLHGATAVVPAVRSVAGRFPVHGAR
jgi:hypothetical protein